jgi:hypothetical protein
MSVSTTFPQVRFEEFNVHTIYHTAWRRRIVTGITVNGRTYGVSPEFWRSLLACFHIAPSAADFMDYADLFSLLQETSPHRELRYQVRSGIGGPCLVGVDDPNLALARARSPLCVSA